ncbi:MAG: tRNA (uridine(34)/cytosine(34)/5-carboxymethylaminomethyluridine(34)-2'-O)-methyltransferase TrmL [Pseudomonadota bacterium]
MIKIVLYQPEIPPNTGNIIRLCANTGCELHLIKPLGFELDDKRMRRAGLDYEEWATVAVHDSLSAFIEQNAESRVLALSTRGAQPYSNITFRPGDALLFGPETRGLPQELLDDLPEEHRLRIPMRSHSRSLNLSNAVAVVCYEALRQSGFDGLS